MVEFLVSTGSTTRVDDQLGFPPQTAPEGPRTLLDVFAATVLAHGGTPAIEAPDAGLTYIDLAHRARHLAQRLRTAGVGPGDRVGVRLTSGTAELYIAILGVLHAGAAYVPVDIEDPEARAAGIWEAAGVCAVLGDGLAVEYRSAPAGSTRDLQAADDAWVIFTSGSTGLPKGVAVSHAAAVSFVEAERTLWSVGPGDRVLAGLSVGFDASCEEIWTAWAHGATLFPAPRQVVRSPTEFGAWLRRHAITVISTVPTLAALWEEGDLESVRLLILGGEACPEALAWRLSERREVWNTYGPTEATVVSTASHLAPGEPVTIGWALPGWRLAILGEDGEPAALGEAGELAIGGVGLGRYLDPALDAERFAPLPSLGWERAYRTGDIVRETVHGLEFVGRRDEQVKLGGRRLELGEVDGLINAVPGVRAGAAAVRHTEAGNPLLVAYYVGDAPAERVRTELTRRLPHGISPLVVALEELPAGTSGKVSRKSLPWPPPAAEAPAAGELRGTAKWLAERWTEQLGPQPISAASDFFALGGSSLAAAKLTTVLRDRYPAVAVSDIYAHRTLVGLADRLDSLQPPPESTHQRGNETPGSRAWGGVHLAALLAVFVFTSPQWVVALLAFNKLAGVAVLPAVGWGWLAAGWLIFGTVLGRSVILLACRRLLLPDLRPGTYPRRSWLSIRIWLLERLAESYRSEALAGTPFAARWARLCGHEIGTGARLGVLPPVTSLVRIGAGATIEAEADLHGWWYEGEQLVIGEVTVGANARVGARALLAPGAMIGENAEVEPTSVVAGAVPAGERWQGSPAKRIGRAGEMWPEHAPPAPRRARFWKAMFLVGLMVMPALLLLAAIPSYLFLALATPRSTGSLTGTLLVEAPLFAVSFLLVYAVLLGLVHRAAGRLLRPGLHPDIGSVGWATWFTGQLMGSSRSVLFSLYASLFTRSWLRLAGIPVGRRAEVSTVVGANRLCSFGERSFCTDDVYLGTAIARGGWLRVSGVEVGAGSFLGNGACVPGNAAIGAGCTIGVLTTAPDRTAPGTSWFGVPALELPRAPMCADPAKTVDPPLRRILARALMDSIRIFLPATLSAALGGAVISAMEAIGQLTSVPVMIAATPLLLIAAGVLASALTALAKWVLIGRYRPGNHPLWSFFVWRDEILNSLQDQLAGTWLLGAALGTSVMSAYLRLLGARVGRNVLVDSLTITEFDMVTLGDGCSINRHAVVQTHLFHDRLLQIGPASIGARSSLAPAAAVLPSTVIGHDVRIEGHSVVMRGEELPPCSRWQGAPVVSA